MWTNLTAIAHVLAFIGTVNLAVAVAVAVEMVAVVAVAVVVVVVVVVVVMLMTSLPRNWWRRWRWS